MNILLVEDHPIFRFGVKHLLMGRWPQAHIQEADSLRSALAAIPTAAWDVVVADLNLPDAVGLEAVTTLRRAAGNARILVLSLHEEAAYARQVLLQGAQGYLTKENAPDQLIAAIEQVVAGQRYISNELAQSLAMGLISPAPAQALESLGPQEYRVMLQIIAGARVSEIAERMHLSPKTVSTYRTRIFEKLGVASNVELASYCRQHDITADAG